MNEEFPFDMSDPEPITIEPQYYNQMNLTNDQMKKQISSFHLKSSIYNCQSCPLNEFHKPMTFANMDADLMIIGHHPEDLQTDSEEGKKINQILRDHNIPFDGVYTTSLIKCEGGQSKKCESHLISEVLVVQPLMIIVFGYEPGLFFIEDLKQPGQVRQFQAGIDLIVTHHSKEILENTERELQFKQHLTSSIHQLQLRQQQRRV